MKEIPLGLTFDDVLLVPNHSAIESRSETHVGSWLTHCEPIDIPIIASPMDTVTEWEMAQAMSDLGGIGVIHRYMSIDDQVIQFQKVSGRCAVAIGVTGDYEERLEALLRAGANIFVIDVAYGDAAHVLRVVDELASQRDMDVIAGNVATAEGFANLANAGAAAIRVGIGGGSACTTRITTGIGVPQLTAIMDCVPMARMLNVNLIADGGIRNGADVAKALAAGADSVMLGGLLAGAKESPGNIMDDSYSKGPYKSFRGMASWQAQISKHHKLHEEYDPNAIYSEGVVGYVEYSGPVKDTITKLLHGLRSAFSYVGASNLGEFQARTEFIRVTQAGIVESNPHDMKVF